LTVLAHGGAVGAAIELGVAAVIVALAAGFWLRERRANRSEEE